MDLAQSREKRIDKIEKYSRIHNVVSKKPHRPSTFAAATGSILFAARDYFCNCRCTRCSRYRTGVDGSPRWLAIPRLQSDRYGRGAFKSIYGHARVPATSVSIVLQRVPFPYHRFHPSPWKSSSSLPSFLFFLFFFFLREKRRETKRKGCEMRTIERQNPYPSPFHYFPFRFVTHAT